MSIPSSDATTPDLGRRSSRIVPWLRQLPYLIGRPAGGIDYIPQVDGLRFLSIVLVMFWHASLRASRYAYYMTQSGTPVDSWYLYIPHGEIGVDFFFFISAYVITQLFRVRRDRPVAILDFYRRRAKRIYPPYLVALLICFAILTITGYAPGKAPTLDTSAVPLSWSFLGSLFYLHGLVFASAPRLNPPMWSLEIEIQFYLLSPFLWILLSRLAHRGRLVALVLAMIVFTVLPGVVKLYYPLDERFQSGLFTHLYLFAGGAIAAELDLGRNLALSASRRQAYDLMLLAGLALLLWIGESLTVVDATPIAGWATLAANGGILLSIFAIFLGALRGRFGRLIFGNPWFCLVGTMCYSIYLTHIVVMQGVADKLLSHLHVYTPFLIWPIWFAILLPASIGVGGVFYVLVERPFMSSRRPVRS